MSLPPDNADRRALHEHQTQRLRAMIAELIPANPFWRRKFDDARLRPDDLRTPADLATLPFTTKDDLLADQAAHPPYGTNLTYPLQRYTRMHQTSGTTGRPLRWLDTPASWSWWLDCWTVIYDDAGVTPADRLMFPFSFGPFIGFWTAFEAAQRRGNFCLAGGGMSSAARLRMIFDHHATIVVCTPTYALRLAEVAADERLDLADGPVRALIVAGEPGGCVPATRARIEAAWGARLFDHWGMTELGALAFECRENPGGLHLNEWECLVEILPPNHRLQAPDRQPSQRASPASQPPEHPPAGELVVTNLGRRGSPLLRYRTGDLVRIDPRPCTCGRPLLRLQGGILGRADDMISIRGNNVYPSAIEAVLREFAEVAEYRIAIDRRGALPEVRIDLEPLTAAADRQTAMSAPLLEMRVARTIRDRLNFRAQVRAVPPGTLPRFELKARRVVVVQ